MAVYVGIDVHKHYCQGVDYYAAMFLLSEIGDVHRFNSDEKLVSWVGLAPQVHQSGETNWTRIQRARFEPFLLMCPIRQTTRS